MLVRGKLSGAQRIARHLRRMCFALFIAAGSFFLGPSNRPLRLVSTLGLGQQLFPALLRRNVLFLLTALPLILMIFWMFRVRFTNEYKRTLVPGSRDVYTLRLSTEAGAAIPSGELQPDRAAWRAWRARDKQ